MAGRTKYRYQEYTWLEMREIVKQQPVVVLPVGSVEDHGPHLPLDVDNFLIGNICEEAARRMDGEMLLLPPIPYGFEEHHMDFPARSTLLWNTCCILFSTSLAVWRVMVSRAFFLPTAMVRICPFWIWWHDVPFWRQRRRAAPSSGQAWRRKRLSGFGNQRNLGGMAHACELETSLYLYLDPARVQMDKAQKEIGMPPSRFIWMDLMSASPVLLMDRWSRFSKSGVVGDPTLATREKGETIFEAVVAALVEFVREFKAYDRGAWQDLH